MKISLYILLILLSVFKIQAQTHLKLMSYNLLQYPSGTGGDRSDELFEILQAYQPDIFMACEIENQTGADEILYYCLGTQNYAASTFSYNHSGSYTLQQMLYYNKYKFELVNETYLTTYVRDINHYTLKLKSDDPSGNIFIDVYVVHLKAGNYSNDPQTRDDMVQVLINDLPNIPSDHFVIVAGDFNLYSANEPAYQDLLAPGNAVVLKDPVDRPGYWHNNANFKDILTQSTHSVPDNNFVGGGLDDRFDFILLSDNLMSSPVLHYVNGSYDVYGNNGTCFNRSIISSDCQGSTYDDVIRQHLYNMSDHLPVVLTLETPVSIGIDEIADAPAFQIAGGNPVHSGFSIVTRSTAPVDFGIYNTTGQLVKTCENYHTGDYIDVSDWASGIYFVKQKGVNNQQLIKIVKDN